MTHAPRTTVRIGPDADAFERLTDQERVRLFVRILCELVAYGEVPDDQEARDEQAELARASEAPAAA